MRILIAGDFHGNVRHARKTAAKARSLDADMVFQVGDFGFTWDGPERLYGLNNVYQQFDMPLYWLDGNHENFDVLEAMGARPDDDEMTKLASNITYVPRGYMWEWDETIFLAMGGAYSIDKAYRVPGTSWWPQELITDRDVERVTNELFVLNGFTEFKVDVMLTHDVPEIPPVMHAYMTSPHNEYGDYKMDPTSKANRERLRAVMDAAQPKLLVHGHMHHRYNDVLDGTAVVGLDRDDTGPNSWVLIDTKTLDEDIEEIRP